MSHVPAANPLHGIKPENVFDEYQSRGLDSLSDAQLVQHATPIISNPVKSWSSFILHAPLELLARHGLLSFVEPEQRLLARQQLVASVAHYQANPGEIAPAPLRIAPFTNPSDALAEFTRTFHAADAAGLEGIVMQFAAQYGVAALVNLLTPLALPTLSGASHSHIGLWLLLRHGQHCDIADASLLRAAAKALASDPKGQLKSFDGLAIGGDKALAQLPSDIEREVFAKLSTPARSKNAYGAMRNTLTAGEATGNADALFAEFIRHDLTSAQIDAAFRAALRICAHNMLQHDTKYSTFGWSHCLTLPQAACGLSSLGIDRKRALATTLVWATAYRSVISDRDLDLNWTPTRLADSPSVNEALRLGPEISASRVWYADPSERPMIKQALATQASIRNDQHLIKYTRACFDMIAFDPEYEHLYLAAAAYLCGFWINAQPDAVIRDELIKRV